MMNEKYNAPNSACCGRPMNYAPKQKCGQNRCCFNEYNYKMNACIRRQLPDCMAQAVIPAITLENTDGLSNYHNAFIHVTSNNTTFYVDDKGAPMIVWKGDVETQIPEDIQDEDKWKEYLESFNLRSQFLYGRWYNKDEDSYWIETFYYDATGKIYWAGEFEYTGIGG